jgi:exopolysaccharide biosynthesis predicted pyruvyltransferase EpsI
VIERHDLIHSLRNTIQSTIGPLLPDRTRVALLDFPNQSNVGDSAIWLGEMSTLRALGIESLCYTSDLETYDEDQLRKRLADGIILLHGGGNLGDIWPKHHAFREQILQTFPNHRVIQLPQSIWFDQPAALSRTRAVFNAHPNFVLLVRDQRSLDLARNEFRVESLLCPDLAFHLGTLPRPVDPSVPVLWLARTDRESRPEHVPAQVPGLLADWVQERGTFLRWVNEVLSRKPYRARTVRGALSATYEPLAWQRFRRGCELLSRGRTVVTDRLHAHILCLLMGIPHVLLDNSYGKLSSFYQTWTSGCALARWADSAEQALALTN